jgi:ParB family transcriptional regulator, chromosome partitioning protein
MKKKSGLGRGLDSLLGDALIAKTQEAQTNGHVGELAIELIQAGKFQPRMHFDQEKLKELAASIQAQGMVQPVVVRAIGSNQYELIAGERRWRAAQLAGMRSIPAIIRVVPDQAAIAMSLIENIQRENLSPIEEAAALKRLIDEFDLTHQGAADAVGRSRVAVSNLLRLLDLAPQVRKFLEEGALDMGHARALLSLEKNKQIALANQAVADAWTVRETEAQVRKMLLPPVLKKAGSTRGHDPNIAALTQTLSERLGAVVKIDHGKGRGKLVIQYASLDELDGILARIH